MNIALEMDNLPPMLRQYLDYKRQHPDCLLLFQVGDFYETFFEDAVTISRALNLTLTSRDKDSPAPVPMAGVPVAVVDTYLERLVSGGFSVALVSQAGLATGKGMVARRLERIVTPGIKLLGGTESRAADAAVAAVHVDRTPQLEGASDFALVFSEIQSGRVRAREGLSLKELCAEILRIGPAELLLPRA
jgi:DNA mismatch repair protein MutS